MDWAELFERAAPYRTDADEIAAALRERREGGGD